MPGCSVGVGSGSGSGAGGSVGASVGACVGFDDDELLCGLLLDEGVLLLDELCDVSLLLLSGGIVSSISSTFVFFALLSLSASMNT